MSQSSPERSDGGGRNSVYSPRHCIKLGIKNNQFTIHVTKLLKRLSLEAGDNVEIIFEVDEDGSPMLGFIYAGEEDLNGLNTQGAGSRVRKIQGKNDVTERITLPSTYVESDHPHGLGIDRNRYDGSDPLIFNPMYEPGSDYFGLTPLGLASQVFRNPEKIDENPVFEKYYSRRFSEEEFTEHTTYDGGDIETHHLSEMEQFLANSPDHEEIAFGDVVGPRQSFSDGKLFFRHNEWIPITESRYQHYLRRIPSSLTLNALDFGGLTTEENVITVERNGRRYLLAFIEPGSFAPFAEGLFNADFEYGMVLEYLHTRTAREMFLETYEARGVPVEDVQHRILSGSVHAFIIPLGRAKKWFETDIAVNVSYSPADLDSDVVPEAEGKDDKSAAKEYTQQTLMAISGAESVDTNTEFWQSVLFEPDDIVEYMEEGMAVDEIAQELGYQEHLIQKAIEYMEI